MTNQESCAGVVLAAGEARRFGAQKLVMPFGESTVIGSVMAALEGAGVAPIVVVVGEDDAVAEALRETSARIVRNPDPARGMVSSIQVGVAALPEVERFLIALGDQPRLTVEGVARLLRVQAENGKGVARPVYRGERGHPVVFAGRYRQEVLALAEGQSLRDVVRAHLDDCVEVAFGSDAFVRDIDTREDYERESGIGRGVSGDREVTAGRPEGGAGEAVVVGGVGALPGGLRAALAR